ncbi:MAG: segregation/condensation protein A [Pseudomonadota bacterium]
MTDHTDYEVKLEIFEGPLDLLLHLIRKNEVDIFDIPVAVITDQYLAYLDMMKALNMSVAGDFLVMASTLLHIKSRMLLPGFDDDGEEDPREELTRPLLEYIRLKEIAEELSGREILGRDVFARSLSPDDIEPPDNEGPLLDVSLFQLMDAFREILARNVPGTTLEFSAQGWSIKDKTTLIIERLKKDGGIYFQDLFSQDRTASEFVVTFLALLELVHMNLVRIFQTDLDRDIRLEGLFEANEENDHG